MPRENRLTPNPFDKITISPLKACHVVRLSRHHVASTYDVTTAKASLMNKEHNFSERTISLRSSLTFVFCSTLFRSSLIEVSFTGEEASQARSCRHIGEVVYSSTGDAILAPVEHLIVRSERFGGALLVVFALTLWQLSRLSRNLLLFFRHL